MIYLDNAATTFPKPRCVAQAMLSAHMSGANPGRGGHMMSLRSGEIVFSARETLAEMFGASAERVIFTKNCTESVNIAVKGTLKKGDHVIISSLEHNSVSRPVEKLKSMGIIDYDIARVDPLSDENTVESFRSLIRPKTKLIICCHVSNVFGTVLPIEELGKMCRQHKIIFAVDAAQSAGAFRFDMKNSSIDMLCLPGHKGLMGPLGTGVLILGEGVTPDSFIEGGTGSFSMEKSQPEILPDHLESGTCNLPGIAGLAAGARFVRAVGEEKIKRHEDALCGMLIQELSAVRGARVYSEMHGAVSAPVVSFNLDGKRSEQVAEALDQNRIAVRAGYHCSYLAHSNYGTADTGTVRVSPGFFNDKKDIKNLIFSLNKIANSSSL